jgi:gliding motility-associated-like protein
VIVTSQFSGGGTTCPGGQQNFTITVNPTPTVNDPQDQVVCNGSSTTQVTFTGTGTSYTWTNNTPSIGLSGSGTGPIAPFTAVNNGTTAITATITVTPVFSGSGQNCSGPSQTFTITVNPTPTVNDPSDLVVCAGTPASAVNFSGTGTSYSWTNNTPGIGLAASGTGNISSFTAQNVGIVPIVATITVNPDFTGGSTSCSGVGQTFTITVNPIPSVNDLPDQTVCNGTSLNALLFSGTGTSYSWVNSSPSIGLTGSGTGNIGSFTGTNSTVSPVTGTVTVTPQYLNAGLTCSGTVQTIDLTVNPTPGVTDPQDLVVCNGSSTTPVTFSGTGTSYSWTNSNPGIGLPASGSGNIGSFTAVNATTTPITVTVTVVPEYSFNGVNCTGPSQTFTITVNPTPTVSDPSDQVVCNGSSTQAVLFSGTGTGYSWTNTSAGIGLGTTGSGNITSFTATNAGSTPVTGTITVTPQYTNAGLTCNGAQQQFLITVNPTPVVNDPANLTVCNNSSAGPINFSGTGTVYSWTNNNTTIGLSASGSGTIPSFNASNGSSAIQSVAIITVTAFFDQSGVSCQGSTETFTITVNPTSVVTDPTDQVVCNGASTAAVNFVGTGTSYQWSNDLPSIGLAASGTGNIPVFSAVNTGSTPVTSTVNVTPIYTSIDGTSCPGIPETYTYTVNPSPLADPIADFSVCNTTTLNVQLTSNINANFSWYAEPNSNVSGDVNIPQPSSSVSNTLENLSTTMQNVIYHVIPTSAPQGCIGPEITFTVEVVPDVELTSPLNYEICSGGFVNAFLQSNVPATYLWIATDNPNVSGESTVNQTGSFINDQLINNTTVPQIVIYTVFPTSVTASCPGSVRTIAVLVRPPLDLVSPAFGEICSGESPDLPLQANVAATFNWFASDNPNVTGESTSVQSSGMIDDQLVNTTSQPELVSYSVVASSTLNGCVSPVFTVNVLVNPLPQILNQGIAICTGENTNITILSDLPSLYSWSAQNAASVTGETQLVQSSGTIDDQLFNTVNSSQTVNYVVTPTEITTGCVGPATTIPVIVHPLPVIQFGTDGSVLCSLSPVVFVNNSDPAFDYSWQFGDGNGSFLFEPQHTYGSIGTYTVTLTGTNPATGCINSGALDVTLEDSPPIGFYVTENEGCVIFDVLFTDTVALQGSTLLWDFGDGQTSNQPGFVDHQYNQAGCYDVTLTVTSPNGCVSSLLQEDYVCAYDVPFASFMAVSDTMPTTDPVFEFVNNSDNAYTYVWLFGDGTSSVAAEPIHTYPEEPGSYVVTLYAFNELGCYDSTFYTVVVLEELLFYVPNSFTPNNDGTNDIFLPVMTQGFDRDSYTLSIFNRWGEEIFVTNDSDAGWDGTYLTEDCQTGVYTWKITFGALQNEDVYEHTGHVTLVK